MSEPYVIAGFKVKINTPKTEDELITTNPPDPKTAYPKIIRAQSFEFEVGSTF